MNLYSHCIPFYSVGGDRSSTYSKVFESIDEAEILIDTLQAFIDWREPSFFRHMILRFCLRVCSIQAALVNRTGSAYSKGIREF